MAYNYPAELYKGWDPEAAQQDYNATGGVGKAGYTGTTSGGGGADSYMQDAINAILGLIPDKIADYEQTNPFFFDEILAKEASTAEYSPYYGELLSDYVSDVEKTKSRSQEDLKTTLEQLLAGKEYYTGVDRRALDKALRQTNEGYAGQGLFFSGVRGRDLKELQTEYGEKEQYRTGTYGYQKGQAETGAARSLADVATGQTRYTRDIGREKEYAIEAGVLQRKGEAQEEYEWGRKKFEKAQFPAIYGGMYG